MHLKKHLSLCTLIAALAITPGCMHTPGKTGNGNDASGAAEPDLLQTLRNRMARGNLLGNKKKAQELANAQKLNAVGADTSRQSAVAAAAASLGLNDPVKIKQFSVVADDYKKALLLMRDGKDDEAMPLLERVVAKAPNFSGPIVNQGLILLKTKQYDRAERVLRRATVVNPKSAYAFNLLGVTLREEGKFADAKTSYESALKIDPDYARAHFNLGVLADIYLQDLPLALTHYRAYQALQCKPDKAVANWISDLQRRSNAPATDTAPLPITSSCDSPAPTANSAVLRGLPQLLAPVEVPQPAANSGKPADLAASGKPAGIAASGASNATTITVPAGSATSGAPAFKAAKATPDHAQAAPTAISGAHAPAEMPKPAAASGKPGLTPPPNVKPAAMSSSGNFAAPVTPAPTATSGSPIAGKVPYDHTLSAPSAGTGKANPVTDTTPPAQVVTPAAVKNVVPVPAASAASGKTLATPAASQASQPHVPGPLPAAASGAPHPAIQVKAVSAAVISPAAASREATPAPASTVASGQVTPPANIPAAPVQPTPTAPSGLPAAKGAQL